MRLLLCLISALLVLKKGRTGGALAPTSGTLSQRGNQNQRLVLDAPPAFNLQVSVNEVLSGQYLPRAVVDVYINYTRTSTALTGDDGRVVLHAPYGAGLPVVVVASKHGYICTPLSLNTRKNLIFSSVTISLLGQNQGSIWLFEDSVLITGRTSDASSQPVVKFPKSLLNLTDSTNLTSVKAYLSIPKFPSDGDSFPHMSGIMSRASGYVSVELRPVAAISVQLFSGNTQLHVNGPVMINLRVTDSCGLQPADAVPAWFFNQTTGAWMRKGLGTVASVDGRLLWTFTAPHLGYWIAASFPSSRGFLALSPTEDSPLLMFLFGGMLLAVVCFLVGFGYCHRKSVRGSAAQKIPPVIRKDQTTCTYEEEVCEESSGQVNGLDQSLRKIQRTASCAGGVMANASMNPNSLELTGLKDLSSEQRRAPAALTDNLFFINQPVAILHAPALFHLEEQPDQHLRSKSAPLAQAGPSNNTDAEPVNQDGCTQTPALTQNKAAGADDQLRVLESCQAASSTNGSRAHFSLPESMSVPGTLNRIRESRHSVNALVDLSKIPSAQAPRAWFVSLEGKPVAEIHYAVSEQQRRRRPVESPETSLDSGVDLSEGKESSGRRLVTLERNATFVKSSSTVTRD